MIGSSLEAVKSKLAASMADEKQPEKKPVKAQTTQQTEPDAYVYQDNALAAGLTDAAIQDLFISIDSKIFAGEERQAVAEYLKTHPGTAVSSTPADLQSFDTYVKILLLKADARYAGWSDQDRYFETARLLRQVTNEHKKQKQEQLTRELREAEASDDDARAMELRTQLNTLIKEITRGQR